MIPVIPEFENTTNTTSYSDKTYLVDYTLEKPRIRVKSVTGGTPAMAQTVFFILNTERYKFPIYSWNYGVELVGLFGQPMGVVRTELPRRIREALTTDDRVYDVSDFSFYKMGNSLTVGFIVYTKYGTLPVETEVDI